MTENQDKATWLRTHPTKFASLLVKCAPFVPSNWVDSSLQLYRDGNYVGQSRQITPICGGIGFGVDPQILVKQITGEGNQGNEGV